jgi:hypothetical protein
MIEGIYIVLDLIIIFVKILLVIIFAPKVVEIFVDLFMYLIKFFIFLFLNQLKVIGIRIKTPRKKVIKRNIYNFFILGEILERLFIKSVAYSLGRDIISTIQFDNVGDNDANVIRNRTIINVGTATPWEIFLMNYASYLLLIFGYFVYLKSSLIQFVLYYYFGLNSFISLLIVWYVIISIFLTGRPNSSQMAAPFTSFIQQNPLTLLMSIFIIMFTISFIPFVGIPMAQTIAILQFVALFLMETRMKRVEKVLKNPESSPDRFKELMDIGAI